MTKTMGFLGTFLLSTLVLLAQTADVSGTWRVTISRADGQITGKASFKQSGDKVTGWVGPSENDPIPITGTVRDHFRDRLPPNLLQATMLSRRPWIGLPPCLRL